MRMFCRQGRHTGTRILKSKAVERMFTPVWTYDPGQKTATPI